MDKAGDYKCQAVYVVGGQTITRTSTTAKLFVRGTWGHFLLNPSSVICSFNVRVRAFLLNPSSVICSFNARVRAFFFLIPRPLSVSAMF